MYGGSGKDRVRGGPGGDDLWGEEGNDRILGGRAMATTCSASRATIDSWAAVGVDSIAGGYGNDFMSGGPATDFVDDTYGSDVAMLGAGAELFESLHGAGSGVRGPRQRPVPHGRRRPAGRLHRRRSRHRGSRSTPMPATAGWRPRSARRSVTPAEATSMRSREGPVRVHRTFVSLVLVFASGGDRLGADVPRGRDADTVAGEGGAHHRGLHR